MHGCMRDSMENITEPWIAMSINKYYKQRIHLQRQISGFGYHRISHRSSSGRRLLTRVILHCYVHYGHFHFFVVHLIAMNLFCTDFWRMNINCDNVRMNTCHCEYNSKYLPPPLGKGLFTRWRR